MKDRPFALVGVNVVGHEPKKLKAVMQKYKLNWRSFAASQAVLAKWNNPPTPGYYVLDVKGIIRRKWVGVPGEKAMESALEKLIKEAEKK